MRKYIYNTNEKHNTHRHTHIYKSLYWSAAASSSLMTPPAAHVCTRIMIIFLHPTNKQNLCCKWQQNCNSKEESHEEHLICTLQSLMCTPSHVCVHHITSHHNNNKIVMKIWGPKKKKKKKNLMQTNHLCILMCSWDLNNYCSHDVVHCSKALGEISLVYLEGTLYPWICLLEKRIFFTLHYFYFFHNNYNHIIKLIKLWFLLNNQHMQDPIFLLMYYGNLKKNVCPLVSESKNY
jgi:hypothetical protein